MAYPVVQVQRSALLEGQRNGKLDAEILLSTPGQMGGATVMLLKPAGRAWRALADAAKKAGHVLKTGAVSNSYRLYEIQERIFRERYTTTPLPGRPTKRWNGQTWYQKPGTAVAAVPGTSNHGWALAVDTGEERDSDAGAESLDNPTLSWLLANEQRFGFSHEVQSEPWHIRYFAGDDIPAAVLAYERGHGTPPPDEEDEDMASQIVWYKGTTGSHAYHVFGGGLGKHLSTSALDVCRALGLKEVKGPLGKEWQGTVALLDGPLKNV